MRAKSVCRVSKREFYVAPCWSIRKIMDAADQRDEQLSIILFEEELELAEGLRKMEHQGWKLIEVQPNHGLPTRQLPIWLQPDYYYLFER